jgi:hypothetical protein
MEHRRITEIQEERVKKELSIRFNLFVKFI